MADLAGSVVSQRRLQEETADRWSHLLRSALGNDLIGAQIIINWLYANGIEPGDFASTIRRVLSCEDHKRNVLFIVGRPNTGKTMIAELICQPFLKGTLPNQGNLSEYYYGGLLNKSIAFVEEPFLTPALANDFKNILGGKDFQIAKKFTDRQYMKRTPFVVTTNDIRFGRGFVASVDEEALQLRCFRFNINQPCNTNGHILTLNSLVTFLNHYQ